MEDEMSYFIPAADRIRNPNATVDIAEFHRRRPSVGGAYEARMHATPPLPAAAAEEAAVRAGDHDPDAWEAARCDAYQSAELDVPLHCVL